MIGACRTQMRHVEHDAERLTDPHRLNPGGGEPATGPVLGGPVAQHGPVEVRERRDPHPEPVHRLEEGHVGTDRLASLQRQHERDEPVGECGIDIGAGQTHPNRIRV